MLTVVTPRFNTNLIILHSHMQIHICFRYWYFGPLRTRAAYFFQSLRRKIASEETEIQFSNACSGCKRCVMRELKKGEIKAEEEKEEETFSGGSRWWSSYVKKNLKPKKGMTSVE